MKSITVKTIEEARRAVVAQMAALGTNRNELVKAVGKFGVSRSAVYQFCDGKRPKFNLPDFLVICSALDLNISITNAK